MLCFGALYDGNMINISIGDKLTSVEKTITQDQIRLYADASGDHNPLHTDPKFASATQFGGIIAHGMMTLAFVYEMLTMTFDYDWIQTGKLKVRFKNAVRPDQKVTTWGQITKDKMVEGHRNVECVVGLKSSLGDDIITGKASLQLS